MVEVNEPSIGYSDHGPAVERRVKHPGGARSCNPFGWLTAAIKGQFNAGALPESDTLFFAPFWEGTLTFAPDGSFLVMHEEGEDVRAERVN